MAKYTPGEFYIQGRNDRYNGLDMNQDIPVQHTAEYTTGYSDAENEIVWNTRVSAKVRPFYKTPKEA